MELFETTKNAKIVVSPLAVASQGQVVIPAKAGIQQVCTDTLPCFWIPAFAGMTDRRTQRIFFSVRSAFSVVEKVFDLVPMELDFMSKDNN